MAEPESWLVLVHSTLAQHVSLASIADALSQWMNGERAFVHDHEWQQLSF